MKGLCMIKGQDLKYAEDKIEYWYRKNISFLSIITIPFNTACIFEKIIKILSYDGKKILYVWGRDTENREVINLFKSKKINITYSYIKKGLSNTSLTFTSYKYISNIKEDYDLVIFDDITYFSNASVYDIREILDICKRIGKRVILYSIEKVSLVGEKFELAAYNYDKPFVEPRLITTRINLNNDIPYSLYDYLKWFCDNKRKTVIYVPDDEKVNFIYDYFTSKLKLKSVKIIKADNKNEIKKCEKVSIIKDKAIFIITNKVEELLDYCCVDNAVLLFADDIRFDYKKILYICGQIRKVNSSLSVPEVILVANEENNEIEKAKNMAREFNKKVWEKKLKEL